MQCVNAHIVYIYSVNYYKNPKAREKIWKNQQKKRHEPQDLSLKYNFPRVVVYTELKLYCTQTDLWIWILILTENFMRAVDRQPGYRAGELAE